MVRKSTERVVDTGTREARDARDTARYHEDTARITGEVRDDMVRTGNNLSPDEVRREVSYRRTR